MSLNEKTNFELFMIYKNYIKAGELLPEASEIAKKAFEIAKQRGQRKLELWKKGIRLD